MGWAEKAKDETLHYLENDYKYVVGVEICVVECRPQLGDK